MLVLEILKYLRKMTSVVKVQRKAGILVNPYDVYIGRNCYQGGHSLPASKWANPFSVKQYGLDESLSKYRKYITDKIENDPITYDLAEIRGKRLGCWCYNSKDHTFNTILAPECHGDILCQLCDA